MGRGWTHVDRMLCADMGHSLTNAGGTLPKLRRLTDMDGARAVRAATPTTLNRVCWHHKAFGAGRQIEQTGLLGVADRSL